MVYILLLVLLAFPLAAGAVQAPASVALTWDVPFGAAPPIVLSGYRVYRHSQGQPYGNAVCTMTAPTVLCRDNLPIPGLYSYVVVADYGLFGFSAPSNEITITVNTALKAPQGVRVLANAIHEMPSGPYPLLPFGSVRIQFVDSEERLGENGLAVNVLDAQLLTIWHTAWFQSVSLMPHVITLDAQALVWIDGLLYIPRAAPQSNGTITQYRIAVSSDLLSWTPVVTQGQWAPNAQVKTIRFAAIQGRYVQLTITGSMNTLPFASAAELGLFATPMP